MATGDSALRGAFPAGVLERDGAVVGAWFPVGFVAADGPPRRWVGFRAGWIDRDGRAAHAATRLPVDSVGDGPADWANGLTRLRKGDPGTSRGFGDALQEMAGLGDSWPDMPDNLDQAMREVARRADPRGSKAAATARRAAIHDAVSPFLATVDAGTLDAARATYGATGLDDCWDGYDGRAFPDRPLMAAAGRWPMLARTMLGAWTADRERFARDPGGRGWLDAAVAHLAATTAIPRRCLDAAEGAHDAFARKRAAMTASARSIEDSLHGRATKDEAVAALSALSLAPAVAMPGDPAEWDAFIGAFHALRHALAHAGLREGDGEQDGFLRSPGAWTGWDAWSVSLAEATGLAGVGPRDRAGALLDALRHCRGVARTFADQVAIPSLLLAAGHGRGYEPPPGWVDGARDAVRAATWSGRGLHDILRGCAVWDAGRAAIDGVRLALPGADGIAPSWGACLPDHDDGNHWIRILRDGRELALEGACDLDDMAGLSREEGTASGDCLRGRIRVGAVGEASVDGRRESLSIATFQLGEDRVRVGTHRTRTHGEPPPAYVAFVERYAAMAGKPGVARWVERWDTLGGADGVTGDAGYAWWVPGNVDAVARAWTPHAPSWAHGLGPNGWAAALDDFGLSAGSRATRRERAPSRP